jgi:hypothetical protein
MIGDNILSTLRRVGWPRPAALIIRHSERPHISSAIGSNDVPLTPEGIEAAVRLGHTLAQHNSSIRLFHSAVLRCKQTAESVSVGVVRAGATGHVIGSRNCLGGSYLVDHVTALSLADRLGPKFVRTWFGGGIDPAIIKPLAKSLAEHTDYMVTELARSEPRANLDVHITHDWNVLLFREGIFAIRYEEAGWPEYLDGVVLRCPADSRTLLWNLTSNGSVITRRTSPSGGRLALNGPS